MTRRRLSVALIAAATTAMALVVPANAETADVSGSAALSSGSSLSSAPAEETGTTETPGTETADPDVPEDEVEEPETAFGSLAMTEELEWIFFGLETFFTLGTAVASAAAVYAEYVPGGADQIRKVLGGFGINA